MHAKHTKRWAIEHDVALSESVDPAKRQLAVDRRLLEEPRMEAHGVREFLPDTVRGRFVRTALTGAVTDVILPALLAQVIELAAAGRPLTRNLAARATVYLQARTHYGIVAPADLAGLRELWHTVLGQPDLDALDDLYASVQWIPDGELDRLDDAAREYRRIVDEPDEPPSPGGGGQPAGPAKVGERASQPTGASTTMELARGRSPMRSSRRSRAPAPTSSSSSTRTSSSRTCSPTPPRGASRQLSWGRAGAPACRPDGCPTAASTGRRTRTRYSTRDATPTDCARR